MMAWRARCRFEQEQWTDADDEAQTVLSKPRLSTITKIPALAALAHVRVRHGDPQATPLLDEARDLAMPTGELQRIAPVAAGRAEAAWLQGRLEHCVAEARIGYESALAHQNAWDLGELGLGMWRGGGLKQAPQNAAKPFVLQMCGYWRAAADQRYRDLANALADGYADINVFVPQMRYHYLKADILDATFDHQRPELLVYAQLPDEKRLRLVAVEYAVPTNLAAAPPEGFTGDFDHWDRNDQFGLWTLHAWVWLENPDGIFADLNPRVL